MCAFCVWQNRFLSVNSSRLSIELIFLRVLCVVCVGINYLFIFLRIFVGFAANTYHLNIVANAWSHRGDLFKRLNALCNGSADWHRSIRPRSRVSGSQIEGNWLFVVLWLIFVGHDCGNGGWRTRRSSFYTRDPWSCVKKGEKKLKYIFRLWSTTLYNTEYLQIYTYRKTQSGAQYIIYAITQFTQMLIQLKQLSRPFQREMQGIKRMK